MVGEITPKGCILHDTYYRGQSEVLKLHMERCFIPVPLSLFQAVSALLWFTKVMRPVVGFLRERGIWLIIYLDDILLMFQDTLELLKHLAWKIELPESLSFIVNYREVCHDSQSESRIPGISGRHSIIQIVSSTEGGDKEKGKR